MRTDSVWPVTDHVSNADGGPPDPGSSVDAGTGVLTDGPPDDASADADIAPATTPRRRRRRDRVSRWDRPPEPKDWRYFVGNLGKVLIATGLLMFGFVAYQLWGTGIETARAQNSLESKFEERLAAIAANHRSTRSDTVPVDATRRRRRPSTTRSIDTAPTIDVGDNDPRPRRDEPDASAVATGAGHPAICRRRRHVEKPPPNMTPVVAPSEPCRELDIPEIDVDRCSSFLG